MPSATAGGIFCNKQPATTIFCYSYSPSYILIMKSAYLLFLALFFVGCQQNNSNLQAKIDSLQNALKQATSGTGGNAIITERLQRFDTLDFDFYSHQKWDSLSISHAGDIIVTYPDGHQTKNLPEHIKQLEPMFVFAPDTKIVSHPVKFGSGDWTCVIGEMTGTFSKPMPVGDGKTIPPTGKSFKLSMCTVGHWQGGKMTEELLFWDNAALMQQIGLGK